ncbi:MAG: threonine--tRNA ligase [Candidatus Levybacteria bacterium RIFCSPHIGHO2_01_FULL_40_10]|nr:MAG: threonine--tRNA ligase [Candidatus Levybacteria bacterium RIFCSPHIGHO2_01_FULL_40_10]
MDKNLKDHKQIGQELELFFTDEISPGIVFWLPKGMAVFKELEKYIRELTEKAGYLETSTPIMVKTALFKQSGHWTKFGEHNMYNLTLSDEENDEHPILYTLKPMNCPESTILYRFKQRSYRELPLRLSEIGRLHRREKSGEVNGLLRVRQLTMDDAHIYCREDQIFDEVGNILDMMIEFYKGFGFEFDFRLATRPELYAGTEENWKKAEKDLEEALKKKKLNYTLKPQDGAFYGPKIDVHIKDTLGREWQLATVQLDFHQPEAFKLKYIDNEGKEQTPVMIHRAIFGSFERFIAILTEQYQGAFPLWLAPIQVAVLPVSEKVNDYSRRIYEELKEAGIRCEFDSSNSPIGAKIREATLQKIPFMCIIGEKEKVKSENEDGIFVSVRTREGEDLGVQMLANFIKELKDNIEKRK